MAARPAEARRGLDACGLRVRYHSDRRSAGASRTKRATAPLEPLLGTEAAGPGVGPRLPVPVPHAHRVTSETESEPGAGTTVSLRLPSAPLEQGAEQ